MAEQGSTGASSLRALLHTPTVTRAIGAHNADSGFGDGFGDVNNVWHLLREAERRGVAGVGIEDKLGERA